MTRVKICGIMDLTELECALSSGADAVGFVVEVEGSRHKISSEAARELIVHVPVFTKSVVVVAPDDVDEAVDLAARTGADVLQVHGTLEPDDLAILKERISQKVVAAVPGGDRDQAYRIAGIADGVLIDTLQDGKLGGTGKVHDWSVSADLAGNLGVPVILAGGLRPGNVRAAIRTVRPYAVDVSSGVESSGRKDPCLVERFVKEVRSCR